MLRNVGIVFEMFAMWIICLKLGLLAGSFLPFIRRNSVKIFLKSFPIFHYGPKVLQILAFSFKKG